MPGRRQYRRLPAFDGVGFSQTATLRIPIGVTYHAIVIDYTLTKAAATGAIAADTINQIDEIRVLANGKILQRYPKGWYLNETLLFDKIPTGSLNPIPAATNSTTQRITIPFDRLNMKTRIAEELTAIGTGIAVVNGVADPSPIRTLSLEVDIAAALSQGGNSVSGIAMVASAIQSQPSVSGLVKKVRSFNYPLVDGEVEISDLPRGDLLNRLFIFENSTGAAGDIEEVRVEVDGYILFQRTAAQNNYVQNSGQFRSPQAGVYVWDTSEMGFGSEALPTANLGDMRFIVDGGAAVASAAFIAEYIGPPSI